MFMIACVSDFVDMNQVYKNDILEFITPGGPATDHTFISSFSSRDFRFN